MIYKIINRVPIGEREILLTLRSLPDYEKITVTVVGAYPYCFVKKEDHLSLKGKYVENIVNVADEGFRNIFNEPCFTLYLDYPVNVGRLRRDNEVEYEKFVTNKKGKRVKNKFYQSKILQGDIPYELAVFLKKNIFGFLKTKSDLSNGSEVHIDKLEEVKQSELENIKIPPYIRNNIDIEVLTTGEVPSAKDPKFPIISVQIEDTLYIKLDPRDFGEIGNNYKHVMLGRTTTVKKFHLENDMLRAVHKDLTSGDIGLAWNSNFEEEYIQARSERLNLGLEWRTIQWLDLQEAYAVQMKFSTKFISLKDAFDFVFKYKREKWSLLPESFQDYFTKENETEIIENKDSLAYEYVKWRKTQSGGNVANLYNNKKYDDLAFYNSCDVYDMIALEKICNVDSYLALFDGLNAIRLNNVFVHTFKLEPNFLGFCMINKVASPSSFRGNLSDKEEGAVVHKPRIGDVLNNVVVFDFGRFYPSIIRAKEVSTENDPSNPKHEKLFVNLPDGTKLDEPMYLMPALCKYFVDKRDEIERNLVKYKDDIYEKNKYKGQKTAVKDFTSGLWGYVASPRTRFFRDYVANVILTESREKNILLKNYFEQNVIAGYVFEGAYGDTDSIFAIILGIHDRNGELKNEYGISYREMTDEEVKNIDFDAIEKQANDYLTKICNEDGYPYPITIKAEKLYGKLVLVGKKNYYGAKIWDEGYWLDNPDYDVKGLQTVKSNQEQFSKDFQYSVIVNHLEGGMEALKTTVREYYKKIKYELREREEFNLNFIESVAKPTSIKEEFEDYMKGPKKYIAESCIIWNKRVSGDDIIKKGSKVLLLPLRASYDVDYKNARWLVFTDSSLVDWNKHKLDIDKIFENNTYNKIKNILGSLGLNETKIKEIIKGRKGRRMRI